jgi:hypothetical protein
LEALMLEADLLLPRSHAIDLVHWVIYDSDAY